MKTLFWEAILVALALLLSWWFLLRSDEGTEQIARPSAQDELPMLLTPMLEDPPSETIEIHEPIDQPLAEPAPAPPELGDPESEGKLPIPIERPERPEDAAAPQKIEQAPEAESTPLEGDLPTPAEELMQNEELLESASKEISGESRQGFATVLVAAPEDQLDIASFFGEELVLIPRSSLDPAAKKPRYFRVRSKGSIETVGARPPLEHFRQYRDLFDYEYARLPRTLRELRKCVLGRSEIFLFAALIPVQEWAVVVGRRGEALALSGRPLSDVRRFTLRYQRRPDQGFELVVDEIIFADGDRFRPQTASPKSR